MNIWLGTSAYSYPEWAGGFFPPSLPPARRFQFYSRRFPFVELNDCLRTVPTGELFTHYARMAPEQFRFSVMAPNSVTHELSYRDLHQFREAVAELNGMLKALIVEFPQTFHHSTSARKWVEIVADTLQPHSVGFEFRHWTWARPDVAPWLDRQGAFLVAVDVPDLAALYPRGLIRSGRTIYIRMHARNPEIWKRSAKERLEFDYTEPMLTHWADALTAAAPQCDNAYIIFNNTKDLTGIANAESLAEMLRNRPGLKVMEAAGPPLPTQPSLF